LKALLIVEQCNPDWASVPLVGYRFYQGISKLVETTLVTHERNKAAFAKRPEHKDVIFISESDWVKKYYPWVESVALKGKQNWQLANILGYPVYADFNNKVYQLFKDRILNKEFDIVHSMTPVLPRFPVKAIEACKDTPFILGPVNGGIPFPSGFQETAKKEKANLSFFRALGRALIPGYVKTYKQASKILSGSTYTLENLKKTLPIADHQIELFYENGVTQDFLSQQEKIKDGNKVNLLFVGRLVPYKCADVVIEAIGKLEPSIQQKIQLTIVGDGQEKGYLEQRVQELNLGETVKFTGWVNQADTAEYYRKADIFCFPSIREFGGAVVLEAMACGLPCIVANYGGIAEYVTDETGFRIEPISREYLTEELTKKIKLLVEDENLRQKMSAKSLERVQEFEWDKKAKKIVEIYEQVLSAQRL
jgi:glycosyltransferase involved in cell wall biosynthesis